MRWCAVLDVDEPDDVRGLDLDIAPVEALALELGAALCAAW